MVIFLCRRVCTPYVDESSDVCLPTSTSSDYYLAVTNKYATCKAVQSRDRPGVPQTDSVRQASRPYTLSHYDLLSIAIGSRRLTTSDEFYCPQVNLKPLFELTSTGKSSYGTFTQGFYCRAHRGRELAESSL